MIQAKQADRGSMPEIVRDPDIVGAYLEDASGAPPGRARGLVRPSDEQAAAVFLRDPKHAESPIVFQAARTSLTAGAVPQGEIIV